MRRPVTVTEAPSSWRLAGRLSWIVLLSVAATLLLIYAYQAGELLVGFYLALGACFLGGVCATIGGFVGVSREVRRQTQLLGALEGKELISVLDGWKEDSLTRRVLLSVIAMRTKSKRLKGAVDAAPFLDAMHSRLSLSAVRVQEAGSVCLSLALIGTMAGLGLMLTELKMFASTGALIAGDGGGDIFEALFSGAGPLASLGTAFATSLVGGAAKLVLYSLSNELERGADQVTDHLADALARDIGPAFEGVRI